MAGDSTASGLVNMTVLGRTIGLPSLVLIKVALSSRSEIVLLISVAAVFRRQKNQ
jgi:hypothetical protein